MSTCNHLDLQTLGSQASMPKNLPDHWPIALINYSASKPCLLKSFSLLVFTPLILEHDMPIVNPPLAFTIRNANNFKLPFF